MIKVLHIYGIGVVNIKLYDVLIILVCLAILISLVTLFYGLHKKTQAYCGKASVQTMAPYTQNARDFEWDDIQ